MLTGFLGIAIGRLPVRVHAPFLEREGLSVARSDRRVAECPARPILLAG